jgi:hypothetical protein
LESLRISDIAECNLPTFSGEVRCLHATAPIQVARNSRIELQQQEPMDQSEVWVEDNRKNRREAEESAMSVHQAVDSFQSLHLVFDNNTSPEGVETSYSNQKVLILFEPDQLVGPISANLGELSKVNDCGLSIGLNLVGLDQSKTPNIAAGLINRKRKAEDDLSSSDTIKKAGEDSTDQSNSLAKVNPNCPKSPLNQNKNNKGSKKLSLKTRARTVVRKAKSDLVKSDQMMEADQKELENDSGNEAGEFLLSNTVQMAKEAGLIMPPPPS